MRRRSHAIKQKRFVVAISVGENVFETEAVYGDIYSFFWRHGLGNNSLMPVLDFTTKIWYLEIRNRYTKPVSFGFSSLFNLLPACSQFMLTLNNVRPW